MIFRLKNQRNDRYLGTRVTRAVGFFPRLKGLWGRRSLEPGEGLWIPGCRSIHTFFMLFPIDVVFVAENRVAAVYERLAPFRWATARGTGVDAVELPVDTIARSETRRGDPVLWEAA